MDTPKYINGQGLAPYRDIKYMASDVGRAGCGPIALYNMLHCLGDEADLGDIMRFCSRYGVFSLFGLFGTSLIPLGVYLRKNGYRVGVRFFPGEKTMNRCADRYGAVIINYHWGKGAHFVCASSSDMAGGMYAVYNLSNRSSHEFYMKSLSSLRGNRRFFLPVAVMWAEKKHGRT